MMSLRVQPKQLTVLGAAMLSVSLNPGAAWTSNCCVVVPELLPSCSECTLAPEPPSVTV